MSSLADFINDCYPFFLLTVNDNMPAGRPFGAIMEKDNDLFVATSPDKDVYKQIISNNNVQIIAIKSGTRNWIRVSGIATECLDLKLKELMLNECPQLHKHYSSADDPKYAVFRIKILSSEFK